MNFIQFMLFFLVYDLSVIASNNDWWKYTTIYEVYIWSFKDSNGDGIGDINGNVLKSIKITLFSNFPKCYLL